MKKNLFFVLVMTMITSLLSCTGEVDLLESVQLNGGIIIEVEDANASTRASHSRFTTTFVDGDAIGVYVVDNTGKVINANVKVTRTAGVWVPESDILYSTAYSYYAYFPWKASPTGGPAANSTLASMETNTGFASFISGWSVLNDQSTEANYQSSDLLLGKATVSNKVATFSMEHKMGLAVWEGKGYYDNTGSWADNSADVSGNTYEPWVVGTKRYFICKPGVNYTFHGNLVNISEAGKCINFGVYTKQYVPQNYLTFLAVENCQFMFSKAGLSYSLDNGSTWTALSAGTLTPTVTAGNTIIWKNNTTMTPSSGTGIGTFSSTGIFDAEGNIMSLYYGDDAAGKVSLSGKSYAFQNLFKNSSVRRAHNLNLPATTLANYCYYSMFSGCVFLTTAPELPATTLSPNCYEDLFWYCKSLKVAPELPATTLASNCYDSMFSNCTALTTAPELPATTLADYCYMRMFNSCTSLTTAPELPATTLANRCYDYMFQSCKSLRTAPELPATTLADYCYSYMFSGCTSLRTASELPATTLANYCYSYMFDGCTSLTTAPIIRATKMANYSCQSMFEGCAELMVIPMLPATTLANYCYQKMFKNCVALITVSVLPATTLAEYCYQEMFNGCTSLTIVPTGMLPATTLAKGCYVSMFYNCTSLTTAPELPATTLALVCYNNMFRNCTSLTTAPELPATTLVSNCYVTMFNGCTLLNYIKAAFTTTPSSSYTKDWVSGVAATGTFYKNSAASWDVTGNNGVPSGWTVVTYTPTP